MTEKEKMLYKNVIDIRLKITSHASSMTFRLDTKHRTFQLNTSIYVAEFLYIIIFIILKGNLPLTFDLYVNHGYLLV